MNTNLSENITSQLTPQMIQKVSVFLGETPGQTQTAVDRSISTLLAGLMHLSSSGAGPIQLLNLINQANYGSLLNNLSGLLEDGNTAQSLMTSGQEILNALFPGKLSAVSEIIATTSGVTNTSASSLLSLVAPVVVGVLGRVRSMQGLNAVRLATLLMNQKEGIVKFAPEGLAGVFGLNSMAELRAGRADTAMDSLKPDTARRVVTAPRQETRMRKNWSWPVLAVLAIGFLYFFMNRGAEVAQAPLITAASAAIPVAAPVTLPDGAALSLRTDSFNYNVAAFLRDPATNTEPKAFVFDRLTFDPGTTKLTVESGQAVKDLSAILKAYPAVDVRLNGYTNNVGDAVANKTLSLNQAIAMREALISDGIGVTRVTTAGYGGEKPLVSNETEEGRAKNQRLELVVVKK
jgi:OOP family OmpA-OmpF porin